MFLLQLLTTDYTLQLKTEILAKTVEELKWMGKEMVQNNPAAVGSKYRIYSMEKNANGYYLSTGMLKEGVVQG